MLQRIKSFKHLQTLPKNKVLKNTYSGYIETVDDAINSIVYYWLPDMQEFITEGNFSDLDVVHRLSKEYCYCK